PSHEEEERGAAHDLMKSRLPLATSGLIPLRGGMYRDAAAPTPTLQHWNVMMRSYPGFARACAITVLLLAGGAPAHAQDLPLERRNVISANPFGLLLEFFNGEYERVVSESATVGAGGSYITEDDRS